MNGLNLKAALRVAQKDIKILLKERGTLLYLFVIPLVFMLGFGMVIPILPFYIEAMGAGGSELGLLVAVSALLEFFFAPIWGGVSDRNGRKPVLMIGIVGYGLSSLLFGLSTQLWMLFAARALSGVLSSATLAAALKAAESAPEGSVLLAMSFGRAVIAPRRGCVTDVLDEQGGILYDADDPQGLEGALRVAMTADTEAMGRHNATDLSRFDWSRVAEATRDVYEAAIRGSGPAD